MPHRQGGADRQDPAGGRAPERQEGAASGEGAHLGGSQRVVRQAARTGGVSRILVSGLLVQINVHTIVCRGLGVGLAPVRARLGGGHSAVRQAERTGWVWVQVLGGNMRTGRVWVQVRGG